MSRNRPTSIKNMKEILISTKYSLFLIITCSQDSTIRCWDIIARKTMCTLTNHKKSVRALAIHPKWNSMATASPDDIKELILPKAEFVQNISVHNLILNALAVNSDYVLVS
jgi:pleiotropic regulator 1